MYLLSKESVTEQTKLKKFEKAKLELMLGRVKKQQMYMKENSF